MYFERVKWVEFSPATMTFKVNFAQLNGGAMYFSRSSVGFINMDSMTFSGNTAATGAGGAMYFSGTTVSFAARLSMVFEGNSAFDKGGAMYLEKKSFGVFVSSGALTIRRNILTSLSQSSGSGIYVDNSTLIFSASFMDFNQSTGDFGAVLYGTNDAFIRFTNGDVDITSNTSYRGNGVITWDNGTVVEFTNLGRLRANWNYAENGGFLRISRAGFVVSAREIEITSNIANKNGGSIYLDNAKLEFASPIIPFRYNTAGSSGGAIYLIGSSIALSGTVSSYSRIEFIGNSAKYGGALYAHNYSSIVFEYADVYIRDNESANGGGVVSWEDNTFVAFRNLGELEVIGNKAVWGGFLSVSGADVKFEANRILIASNTALGTGTDARRGYGGGLYLDKSTMLFTNINLIGNTAAQRGGAIYVTNFSSITFAASTSSAMEMTFTHNEADYGGGIYASSASKIWIKAVGGDVKFGGNTARLIFGHDIYIEKSTLIFISDQGHRVQISSGIHGSTDSIIDALGTGDLAITSGALGSFINITSFGISGGGRLLVERSTWLYTKNQSSLYIRGSSAVFNLSTVSFTLNKSRTNGGAIYTDLGAASVLKNSRIDLTSNTSAISGGAIYIGMGSTVSFIDSQIKTAYNTALSSGGFAYIKGGLLKFEQIDALEFIGNRAFWGGGVFYFDGNESGALDIEDADILNAFGNTARNGGFAYLSGKDFAFENLTLAQITGNSADGALGSVGAGGAFYLDNSTLTFRNIDELNLNYNSALTSGGVIYAAHNSLIVLSSFPLIALTSNSAKYGGAVFVSASQIVFEGTSIAFSSNIASSSGGAIYAMAGSTVIFKTEKIYFKYNKSLNGDGVFYWKDSLVSFSSAIIELTAIGNTANNGGFIYLQDR
jgi:predicted outer membrane repeat protein